MEIREVGYFTVSALALVCIPTRRVGTREKGMMFVYLDTWYTPSIIAVSSNGKL